MEDVLAVYTRPDAPRRPQGCLDETSTQRVAATREPIPAAPGQPARVDSEEARQGTANRGMVFEPLAGPRRVPVTARRPAVDCAQVSQEVVEVPSPQAEQMLLVMDHLHTHTPASLSEACAPAEARRWIARLDRHDTPKPGRWLNRAETALSVLVRPCLDRRMPDPTPLAQEVAAWPCQRNAATCRVDWQFTTRDARIKLKRRYPSIQLG